MNNNKADVQGTSGAEVLRTRSTAGARGAEKKHRASFLLVDLLLLLGVVVTIFLLVLAFTPLELFGSGTESREILYTVEFYGVDKEAESSFHEGDSVTDMQTGAVMGVVTQVSSRVYEAYTDTPTDEIVPEFDKYVVQKQRNEEWRVITVTIKATAEYKEGVGYSLDANRIAIGREYQLRFPAYANSGVCVSLSELSAAGGAK